MFLGVIPIVASVSLTHGKFFLKLITDEGEKEFPMKTLPLHLLHTLVPTPTTESGFSKVPKPLLKLRAGENVIFVAYPRKME